MNGGYCDICGQPITDASGCWNIHFHDLGIFHQPQYRVRCCAFCKAEIDKMVDGFAKKRKEERKQ